MGGHEIVPRWARNCAQWARNCAQWARNCAQWARNCAQWARNCAQVTSWVLDSCMISSVCRLFVDIWPFWPLMLISLLSAVSVVVTTDTPDSARKSADTRRTDYSSSCYPISTDLGGSTKNAAMISVPDSTRKSANTR